MSINLKVFKLGYNYLLSRIKILFYINIDTWYVRYRLFY